MTMKLTHAGLQCVRVKRLKRLHFVTSRKDGTMNGFICSSPQYQYQGVAFELHGYCGPVPLRKDGEPAQRASKRTWEVLDQFMQLPIEDRKKYLVCGGCSVI